MKPMRVGGAFLMSGMLGASLLAGLGSAAADPPRQVTGWTTIASYCSPSGDVCYGIRKKGAKIQFRLDSFVDFGSVDFCVKKQRTRNWVCNERDLRQGKNDLYFAKIRWQGNYPTGGHAKRVVRFMKGSPKLRFQP